MPVVLVQGHCYAELAISIIAAAIPAEDVRLSCSFLLASQTFIFAGSLTDGAAVTCSASLAAAAAATVLGLVASH